MTNLLRTYFQKRESAFWVGALLLLVMGTLAGLLGNDLIHSYQLEFAFSQRDARNLSDALEREIQANVQKIDVVLLEAEYEFSRQVSQKKKLGVLAANRDLLRREKAIPEAQPHSLRVINAEGDVVYSAGDTVELPPVNVKDRAYFLTQKNNANAGLVVSEPLLSRFTGKWLFTLSRRVSNPDGSFGGVVQTALRTDHFEAGFKNINIGEHGSVALFSLGSPLQLQLMARQPSLPDQIGKPFEFSKMNTFLKAGITSGVYRTYSRVDGTERTFHFKKLDGLPLIVNIGVAPEDLLQSWHSKAWMYGVSLLILALELVLLISYQRKTAKEGMLVLEKKVAERTRELTETNVKLQAAMKAAEAASIAKSAFLANMSHEMRTPLHQIGGVIQLLKVAPLPEPQIKRVQLLDVANRGLTNIIQNILELTSLEANQCELKHEALNIDRLMNSLFAQFENEAKTKRLSLVFEPTDIPNYYFWGDEARIRQALANYLENAIKFTKAGSVTVRGKLIGDGRASDSLYFEVVDTGAGISPEALPRLFSIFEQVDNSSTRQYGGTGIGLAITKKIAELMGGDAGCSSELGRGSTFWVTFRVIKA